MDDLSPSYSVSTEYSPSSCSASTDYALSPPSAGCFPPSYSVLTDYSSPSHWVSTDNRSPSYSVSMDDPPSSQSASTGNSLPSHSASTDDPPPSQSMSPTDDHSPPVTEPQEPTHPGALESDFFGKFMKCRFKASHCWLWSWKCGPE